MPAKSKAQQKYFGYLLSNPDERKKEGVSRKVAREFAGTKHKGLPEKVKENIDEGVAKAMKAALDRDKKARQKKKEKEGKAVPYAMLAQEYVPEEAPTMSTGSTSTAAGFSQDADAEGPTAGLDQPLGGTTKQPKGKGCKSKKKFCVKSKDGVNYVDSRVKSEGFKGQYKDKSKLSQSSQRKSLGRGASIKDGAKKSGYESPKEHRATSKKLAKYQAKGTYNAHLGEGSSIIQGRSSSKKVSYRGPTAEKSKPKKSVSYRGEKDERIPVLNRKGKENKSARYASQLHRLRPASERLGKKKVNESRQPDDGSSKGNPRYLPFHVKNELENIEFIFYGQSPAQVKIQLRKIYRPERLNNFKVKRVYPNDVLKFYWNKRQDAMRANG